MKDQRETQIYVGTSGWSYDWNPYGFDWYAANSQLNSVELNASFYRFPFPKTVGSWARKTPPGFEWSIKVTRWITHNYKFTEKAFSTWDRFKDLFQPLEEKVASYLFQLPPAAKPTETLLARLEDFARHAGLQERFALEFRNEEWTEKAYLGWAQRQNLTIVSQDSPQMRSAIFNTSGGVYLRLHGRTSWYSHNYTARELSELARAILKAQPSEIYVYFNNNHDMLTNARTMRSILESEMRRL